MLSKHWFLPTTLHNQSFSCSDRDLIPLGRIVVPSLNPEDSRGIFWWIFRPIAQGSCGDQCILKSGSSCPWTGTEDQWFSGEQDYLVLAYLGSKQPAVDFALVRGRELNTFLMVSVIHCEFSLNNQKLSLWIFLMFRVYLIFAQSFLNPGEQDNLHMFVETFTVVFRDGLLDRTIWFLPIDGL